MADNKIKVGYYLDRKAQLRLKGLAERDHRSMSSELQWLIEQEWRQYMALLRATRGAGRPDGGRA